MHATLTCPLTMNDVRSAMESGIEIDDVDFQETLAAHHCLIISPWVCRVKDNGNLEKLTTLRYDGSRHLDRPGVLRDVLRRLEGRAPGA